MEVRDYGDIEALKRCWLNNYSRASMSIKEYDQYEVEISDGCDWVRIFLSKKNKSELKKLIKFLEKCFKATEKRSEVAFDHTVVSRYRNVPLYFTAKADFDGEMSYTFEIKQVFFESDGKNFQELKTIIKHLKALLK